MKKRVLKFGKIRRLLTFFFSVSFQSFIKAIMISEKCLSAQLKIFIFPKSSKNMFLCFYINTMFSNKKGDSFEKK